MLESNTKNKENQKDFLAICFDLFRIFTSRHKKWFLPNNKHIEQYLEKE